MNESTTLTNRERRENVAFLSQAFAADPHLPAEVLDADERARFLAEPDEQSGIFFKLLCYGALAAQPAPESVVDADWRRMEAAGVVDALFAGEFDLTRYAVDPPVSRSDSKGKIIDFARLAEARDTWQGLLPAPADPDVAVDVLHAASGGALKSRAFWSVREMRRLGLWDDAALDPYACVPDGRVRKRAVRMGLIDLPGEGRHLRRHEGGVARASRGAAPRRGAGRRLRPPRELRRPALRDLRRGSHGRLPHAALPLAARARRRLTARTPSALASGRGPDAAPAPGLSRGARPSRRPRSGGRSFL